MRKNRRTWQSFEEVRKAAEQGDAAAQCYLGICYQTGQGVPQDYAEAVKWFRRAADQNDDTAQCYLGFCYQSGLGVPQEYGQAAKWFREAAERGDPAAQFNLGVLYETGQGVPQNYAEAYKWFNIAAAGGGKDAAEVRDAIASLMDKDSLLKAQAKARDYFEKHGGKQ